RLGFAERRESEVRRYVGSPLSEMFAEFAPGLDFDQIRPLFRERALEVIIPSSELLPHATETLQRMRRVGYRLGIGSTKIRPHIRGLVERFGWEPFIESYSGADEAPPKPAPDIFLRTLERLEVDPIHALVVGDTANDTIAARHAGVHVVTIDSDLGDREALAANPPDRRFANLREFTDFMEGQLNGAS
ncbi:MAG TPA: HAD family hydrolase, partial [candidate division Zixibacteria bacterium]|nr:HAD family hydrolase [candidate division Zixibacteria bacterium]